MIDAGGVDTLEMLAQAEAGLPRLADLPEEPAWLEDVESDLELADALAHVTVSPEVAAFCTCDIAQAKLKSWVIND